MTTNPTPPTFMESLKEQETPMGEIAPLNYGNAEDEVVEEKPVAEFNLMHETSAICFLEVKQGHQGRSLQSGECVSVWNSPLNVMDRTVHIQVTVGVVHRYNDGIQRLVPLSGSPLNNPGLAALCETQVLPRFPLGNASGRYAVYPDDVGPGFMPFEAMVAGRYPSIVKETIPASEVIRRIEGYEPLELTDCVPRIIVAVPDASGSWSNPVDGKTYKECDSFPCPLSLVTSEEGLGWGTKDEHRNALFQGFCERLWAHGKEAVLAVTAPQSGNSAYFEMTEELDFSEYVNKVMRMV